MWGWRFIYSRKDLSLVLDSLFFGFDFSFVESRGSSLSIKELCESSFSFNDFFM